MAEWTPIEASRHAKNTTNPIRAIVDQMKVEVKTTKPMIALSIGDPTTDGNLLPPPAAEKAIVEGLQSHKFNGYPPSVGYASGRTAVAEYWVRKFAPAAKDLITPERVVLGSGASHALLMAITAMCNPGDVLLVPSPCFSLYGTIADSYGIEVRHYRCLADRNWEVDLDDLRAQVCPKTKAILLNNPSNPCGSSFTRAHVEAILAVAEEKRVPVIADEIYAGLVFTGQTFTSVADIVTDVPRVVVGGLAKNFIAPGWRLGWLIVVDPKGVMGGVLAGIVALSTLLVGPNSLVQSALGAVLNQCDEGYTARLNKDLEINALAAYEMFQKTDGLKPTTPQGAMYLMVGIDVSQFADVTDGIDFARKLLEEENVQVLPGEIFKCPNYFRIVYTKPIDAIRDAVGRIQEFCARHMKQ